MKWLARNSGAIQATAGVVTALVAVLALIGVKLQLDTADRVQRAQSARDAYRAHLALAITHPGYAEPADSCKATVAPNAAGYVAFVDHLLYAAEQMVEADDNWEETFFDQLSPHSGYLCSDLAPRLPAGSLKALVDRFREHQCLAATCRE